MAKKQFTENNVYWWMSDDDKLTSDNQILFSENIDLTASTDFYTISQRPTIEQVTTDNVEIIFEANNNIFYCDGDANVYIKWNPTPVWTWERISSVWKNSTYLYILDKTEDIWRIALSNVTQVDWTTYITQTDTTITSSWADSFSVTTEDFAYLWIWEKIYRVNNADWVVESANIFTIDSSIVWLSLVEERVEIFTENWNYILRDGVAWWTVRTKYLWLKIWLVKNIANRNYILSWWATYVLNGYSLEQITFDTYSDELDSVKYSINSAFPNLISFQEGLFYIWVEWEVSLTTPWSEFIYWNWWILTLWQKKALLPTARNLFLSKLPNGRRINQINSVFAYSQPKTSDWKELFFWYVDDLWDFWVASINLWGWASWVIWEDWIVVYPTFDWNQKWQQKELIWVKVRVDFWNENSKAYLCTVDNNWELQWINSTKEESFVSQDYVWDDWLAHFKFSPFNFFNITLAIILEQDGSYFRRDWIKFYSLSYEYDDNIRE